jgi:hypothetical protein
MYCGGMICGVEVRHDDSDIVVLYAHKACHVREERTCPDCNNPLEPPTVFQIGPQGHVCEGCRTYYDHDLTPIARLL